MSEPLQARIDSLEAENRVLREENLMLAEHAEEAMLLRTVAEVASWSDDSETLLDEVLERISILRDIPLCACGSVEQSSISLPWCYTNFFENEHDIKLTAPADFYSQLGNRNGLVVEIPSDGYTFELDGHESAIKSLFLLSFSTHNINMGLFVFASLEDDFNWAGTQIFLRQAVDMVAVRLDRLDLVGELQRINLELDLRVKNRTEDLHKRNLELSQLQSLLESVINSMPSILVGVDADGRVLQWNQEAARVSNVSSEEAKGQLLQEVFPELNAQLSQVELAISERSVKLEQRVSISADDGQELLTDITVYPLLTSGVEGAVIRGDDVTERVRLEEVMIQAEKMLSVGGLAAGMAHEINNPLAGILQNLQVVYNRLTAPQQKNLEVAAKLGFSLDLLEEYLQERGILSMIQSAIANGRRAAGIVDNILSFSRQAETKKTPQDLAGILDRTIHLLGNDYDLEKGYDFRKVEIVRDFEAAIPLVPCEETKIQQVLLNILRNGAQAMGSHVGDHPCRFEIKLTRLDRMAQIDICDNGPGMNPEVIRRVFEPFYTTKGVRGGTGLGLSVSYFIIHDQHQGELSVESVPGQGSCFTIRLPF